MSDLVAAAKQSFSAHIEQNPYPGRGLVIGRAPNGDWIQLYWIMGRSEGSRNRVFVAEGPELRTAPWDAAPALGDRSLTLYEAMLELPGVYLVTNGDQTRTAADGIAAGQSFEVALSSREREHDAPHYTPRINGLLDFRGATPELAISILKAHPADPAETDRFHYRFRPPPPGLGLGITTYRGDGDPLPPFQGEPLWLPLDGGAEEVLERYWQALDSDNRVALAVKRIDPEGKASGAISVRNRHA